MSPLKSSIFACICALWRKCKALSKWEPCQAIFFPFVQVWLQVVLNFSLLRAREEHNASLQDILSYSPFKTQAELLQEINAISSSWSTGTTGTRIIIWNLRKSVFSPHLQRCLLILEQHNLNFLLSLFPIEQLLIQQSLILRVTGMISESHLTSTRQ